MSAGMASQGLASGFVPADSDSVTLTYARPAWQFDLFQELRSRGAATPWGNPDAGSEDRSGECRTSGDKVARPRARRSATSDGAVSPTRPVSRIDAPAPGHRGLHRRETPVSPQARRRRMAPPLPRPATGRTGFFTHGTLRTGVNVGHGRTTQCRAARDWHWIPSSAVPRRARRAVAA
jgi:hypothetical protein